MDLRNKLGLDGSNSLGMAGIGMVATASVVVFVPEPRKRHDEVRDGLVEPLGIESDLATSG